MTRILTEKNLAGYRRNWGGAMSRTAAGTGLPVANVSRLADAIGRTWANAPEVVVVFGMQDPKVPQRVREYDAEQRSQGAEGEPEGFYYGGRVYLVAGQLGSPADVVRVLAHEALGHHGLRGFFGGELSKILDQIAVVRRAEVDAKRHEYGLPDTAAGRRVAAEEVLAVMAQTNPQMGFVRRAVAAIRAWLRGLGVKLRMSDNDIIAQFIIPAREWVQRGGDVVAEGAPVATFSRRAVEQGYITSAQWKGMRDGVRREGVDRKVEAGQDERGSAGASEGDSGRLQRFFHGTRDDVAPGFDREHPNRKDLGWLGDGVYVTDDADLAEAYANLKKGSAAPNVLPLAIRIRNPFRATLDEKKRVSRLSKEGVQAFTAELIRKGHDSVILTYPNGSSEVVVFDPANVRSYHAEFKDGDSTDLLFSRATVRKQAANHIADLLQSSKGFNWWHRTIGTQYEKAERNPYFKRVFEAAQAFLNDVSDFANRAADLAPTILPKMNGIKDVLKRPVSKKDIAAITRPIFDGTLYDTDPANGKVWTDDELRDRYGLNAQQIGLYREFRAAVDQSLDDMGKTDLIRYVGTDGDAVRQRVFEAASIGEAAEVLAGHLERMAEADPDRAEALQTTAKTVREKADRISALKAGGYAPLMRFGRFSVYVTRPTEDGEPEQVYFGLFETQREANRMARQFREDPTYADAEVSQGTMSQEAFKLFQGVNPDTLELFADVAGVEQTELFQTYLKLAKSNRSAMKRLINRKGVAGYSEDVTRVLASFITSNSRAAAMNVNVGEMNAAASEVPKDQGDVKDEAVRLVEFVRGTNDPSSKLRGLLFFQYLGGSIASAIVNMTQPLTMTYPYLAQFVGAGRAGTILTKAVKDAVTGVGSDKDLAAALKKAESEGVVSPQEIHHLYSEAGIGLGRNSAVRRGVFLWGSMFSMAEQFNRRSSFIAAYRIAREQGMPDPFAFAEQAVVETQGIYSRANRANWARNPVGATLLTFKQFMVAYLEWLKRLPAKEKALALAVLVLVAGLEELPFMEDAEDVVDTVAQALGYNWNTSRARREWLTKLLGQQGADFALNGISAFPGFPLDVSARLGLGNLIPGTGLLLGSTRDKSREITEVLGAGGSFAQSLLDAGGALLDGDPAKAAHAAAPLAVRNALKGLDMYQTGMYRDTRGRRVIDVDAYDAMVKAIGFQPAEVAATQRKASIVFESVALVKNVEAKIADRWAKGVFERDSDTIKAARDELRDWNRKNPEARISIEQSQINRRVRAMRATRSERMADMAPRELRQAVRESM